MSKMSKWLAAKERAAGRIVEPHQIEDDSTEDVAPQVEPEAAAEPVAEPEAVAEEAPEPEDTATGATEEPQETSDDTEATTEPSDNGDAAEEPAEGLDLSEMNAKDAVDAVEEGDLTVPELEATRENEVGAKNRKGVLASIDTLLDAARAEE